MGHAGEVEEVVDHPGFELHIAIDHLDGFHSEWREIFCMPKGLDGEENRSERSAKLMGKHSDEVIFRFASRLGVLACGLCGGEELGEFVLKFLPLGEVAADFGEAARGISEGDHDFVDPEKAAIFLRAPAFIFGPAVGASGGHFFLREVVGDFIRRIKQRHVLPDHFLLGVAFNACGTLVPARDEALGIEQENRVILHGIDQDPETFLGLPARFLVETRLGLVAEDFHKTGDLVLHVAHGHHHAAGPETAAILAEVPALVLGAAFL